MNILLQALEKSPEYQQLLDAISRGSVAAVSGLSQITRSHFLAALHAKSSRPSVFLVQDELAASRLRGAVFGKYSSSCRRKLHPGRSD